MDAKNSSPLPQTTAAVYIEGMNTSYRASVIRLVLVVAAAGFTASCVIVAPTDPQTEPPPTDHPDVVGRVPPDTPPDAAEDPLMYTDGVDWEVIASGQQSAVRVPAAGAITNEVALADVWRALFANRTPVPPIPAVDFAHETVIVLLLGERRTGGYAVRITEIIEYDRMVEVRVGVETPAPDEMVIQVLTAPYTVATIPITGKDVVFVGDDVEEGFEGD